MNNSKMNQENSHFVFREAANEEELLELLRLRYGVFRNSHLAQFVPENKYGIDLDRWDTRSRHFGLFQIEENASNPVGYIRVVEDNDNIKNQNILNIAEFFPEILDHPKILTEMPFPLMKYYPDKNRVKKLYENIKINNERLVEPGRFALESSVRSRHLGKHIIECAIAVYFFAMGIEHAAWCCISSQRAFYRRYGFHQLESGINDDFANIGKNSCCVFGSATGVPIKVQYRLQKMASAYEQTGSIIYNPSNPNCFEIPTIQKDQPINLVPAVA